MYEKVKNLEQKMFERIIKQLLMIIDFTPSNKQVV